MVSEGRPLETDAAADPQVQSGLTFTPKRA